MSTSQSLPIQVSLPAKPGNSSVSVQTDASDTDSKGFFGGVLSDELDSVSATEVINDEVVVEEASSLNLPLDGNSLPFVVNTELQADIADLDVNNLDDVTLKTDTVDILGGVLALVESPLKVSVTPVANVTKEVALSQQTVTPTLDTIRIVTSPLLANAKTDTATTTQSVSLLPFTDLGIDPETQAVTQFKESLQLQKIFSPLTRQAEVSIEVGQSGRILEQFSELNSKPAVIPTVSNMVNSTPLNVTSAGTAVAAQLSVDVPVQDQRWQKAFSQRVVWSVGNVQSAQIRLNPAELGRIDIQVNIDNDKANVVFTTQQGVVKDQIEQALPRLREMLAEQGVELENVDIFQDNFNQGQAGTNNGSSQQQEVENRQWSASNEEEQADQNIFVSHVAVKDDIVDFYV